MSRNTRSLRGIVLAVSCATAAALVVACTPPLPPDVLAARAESQITCQQGSQDVAVPSEFAGAIEAVGMGLGGVCPEQLLTEVPSDQPTSLELVSSAPTAEQSAKFTETCPTDVAVVPAFAYSVAMAFSVPGLEGIIMTPEVIAGILGGTVRSWDDPAIVEANDGIDLSGLPPITVLALDGPSGSVQAMTDYLTAQAPQTWTAGPVATIQADEAFATQQELIDALISIEGAMAVLPAYVALTNSLGTNAFVVEGQVVTIDDPTFTKIGSGATNVTTNGDGTQLLASSAVGGVPVEGNFDIAASKIVLGEDQALVGWPVMGYAHLMVCTTDALALSTAQYIARLAGQGALETFGVTPMPEPIRIKTFIPLKVVVETTPEGA